MPQKSIICAATVNRYFTQPDRTRRCGPQLRRGATAARRTNRRTPAKVTRDYALELDVQGAPILNVFGGKITTFRRLAEEAVNQLCATLRVAAPPWTRAATLPGGDLPDASLAVFLRAMARRFPWLPVAVRERYARAYGTRIIKLIGAARTLAMMGEEVLPGLYEREIDYLCGYEWAQTARDILWRRSKLGLHLPPESEARLDAWLNDRGLGVSGHVVARRGKTRRVSTRRLCTGDRPGHDQFARHGVRSGSADRGLGQREHPQAYPHPGWVEHDARPDLVHPGGDHH